MVDCRSS